MKIIATIIQRWRSRRKERTQRCYKTHLTGEVSKKVGLAKPSDQLKEAEFRLHHASVFHWWRNTACGKARPMMFKFKTSYLKRHGLTHIIRPDRWRAGKISHDAMGELPAWNRKCRVCLLCTTNYKGEHSKKNVGPNVDSWSEFQPLAWLPVLQPFNFPAMVPLWMYPMRLVLR